MWRWIVFTAIGVTVVMLGVLILESGSDEGVAKVSARVGEHVPGCKVGDAITVPSTGRAIALGCGRGKGVGSFVIAGYTQGGRPCVAIALLKSGEVHGAVCGMKDQVFNTLCGGREACILGGAYTHNQSELSGPIPLAGRAISVNEDGTKAGEVAVAVAHVGGRLLRKMGASANAFGYFALVAPGCLAMSSIETTVLGANGEEIEPVDGLPGGLSFRCGRGRGNEAHESS